MKIKPFNLKSDERMKKINGKIPQPIPKLNQHMLLVAPTNSGKSTIVANLLLGPLKMIYDKIIFFSPTYHLDIYPKLFQMDESNIHTQYSDNILDDIMKEKANLEEELEKKLYYLIIFDDMQEQFYRGGYLENFLCKCRHWGITIWVCAQYAYAISKKSRQQFSCFIMFPMLSNEEDREIIGETAPGSKKQYKLASDIVMKISKEQNNVRNFLFINKSLADKYWFNFENPIEISN